VYLEYFGGTKWSKVLQTVTSDEVVLAHIQQMVAPPAAGTQRCIGCSHALPPPPPQEITQRLLYRAASARAGRVVNRQVHLGPRSE